MCCFVVEWSCPRMLATDYYSTKHHWTDCLSTAGCEIFCVGNCFSLAKATTLTKKSCVTCEILCSFLKPLKVPYKYKLFLNKGIQFSLKHAHFWRTQCPKQSPMSLHFGDFPVSQLSIRSKGRSIGSAFSPLPSHINLTFNVAAPICAVFPAEKKKRELKKQKGVNEK